MAQLGRDRRQEPIAIFNALEKISKFYGDVPSALDCRKPGGHLLVCRTPYLAMLEVLNARAQAYAIENATKQEIDHRSFKAKLPTKCTTELCFYEFYREAIDDALGGDSPFVKR